MRVTILGSGTSHGVPMIGCDCAVCKSDNPKDKRFRPSIFVESQGSTILVDTTPEFRLQAMAFGLKRVDAVFFTHTHADHIFGLDDLRRFNDLQEGEIPVYGAPDVLEDIRRIFNYIFMPTQEGGGKPKLNLREMLDDMDMFEMRIQSMTVLHGVLPVKAFRFNDIAYVTDTNYIPPESMEKLRGLDTLILDCVRPKPHTTHFGLEGALAVIEELKPRQTYLTHLSHKFGHDETNAKLPAGVELAYDGLMIEGY